MSERIAVVGLGYVGLAVALAFAKRFPGTVGFDVNPRKVETLRQGIDWTGEISREDLYSSKLKITSDPADLEGADFFVVAVPTPIDHNNRPDLSSLVSASELVGRVLRPGAVVVYE